MADIHFKKNLIHLCTTQRTTPAQSSSGEPIDSWANNLVDQPCRFVFEEERIAQESVGFMMLKVPFMLIDSGVDMIEEDRIINITRVEDSSTIDAGPFTIEAVLKRSSTVRHHIRLNLEKVE